MNLLLDSHTLVWALHDPSRMRPKAVRAIRDPGRAVFYSAASVWELEIKAARGKLGLPEEWLASAEETGFLHLPVVASEARASARLPWHHTDPFDRLLVAQAKAHGLAIATKDAVMAAYDVRVVEV